ncbi:MAG: cation:proton antiporter [Chloroflexi bacterium]|jgi:Kef-type K+ transport system membrane component KefB|nr:cation:proton antiporter [Chloroflexota bacterium]
MTPLAFSLDPSRALAVAPPGAGSAETLDILVGLFILILAAKVGEEIFRRLGQPGVVGELAGGFVVGPYALGLVVPGETALVLSEIGVVILLFAVGLEIKTDELLQVGRPAAVTAILGVVFPIATGVGYAMLTGEPPATAAFVGLALAATSIGITSRVLADMGVLDRRFSRIIIGAAVIDDILALILIGIVSGAASGDLGIATLGLIVGALGFVALGFAIARRARGLRREVFTWPLFADTPLVPVFIIMLGLAILAAFIGLAAIIGAFVAGLIIAETEAQDEIEHDIKPLASIITPFFFAVTGAQLDLGALADPALAISAVVLAVLGVATKVAAGTIGAWSSGRWSALTVGVGMAPRGEVGIVVVGLGLALGLLSQALFSVVLVAVVLTTVVAPIMLNVVIPRAAAEADVAAAAVEAGG